MDSPSNLSQYLQAAPLGREEVAGDLAVCGQDKKRGGVYVLVGLGVVTVFKAHQIGQGLGVIFVVGEEMPAVDGALGALVLKSPRIVGLLVLGQFRGFPGIDTHRHQFVVFAGLKGEFPQRQHLAVEHQVAERGASIVNEVEQHGTSLLKEGTEGDDGAVLVFEREVQVDRSTGSFFDLKALHHWWTQAGRTLTGRRRRGLCGNTPAQCCRQGNH